MIFASVTNLLAAAEKSGLPMWECILRHSAEPPQPISSSSTIMGRNRYSSPATSRRFSAFSTTSAIVSTTITSSVQATILSPPVRRDFFG